MGNKPLIVVLLCTVLSDSLKASDSEEGSKNDKDLFVPTHEWQVVKRGQKIPKGLHVRINFQTGITEAKILDQNEPSDKTTAVVAKEPATEDANSKLSHTELKEALKNIKNDYVDSEHVKKTIFKSYEELKKDLKDLNLNPQTDNEILTELIQQHEEFLKKPADEDYVLTILEDLEYLVHQIDNANDFITLNGFQKIIYPNLNSTSTKIKESTLKLFGSCMQNNVKVKIDALETGAIGILLKVLVLNTDNDVKNRAVFALGSLLRHFPLAQLRFVENAGLNVFVNVLEQSGDLKIRLKIVTLVNDLLLEHEHALLDLKIANYTEKVQQYALIGLWKRLQSHEWCTYLGRLLVDVVAIDARDHDSIEKSLSALVSLNVCNSKDQSTIVEVLLRVKVIYNNFARENDDNYFVYLSTLCDRALRVLKYNEKSEL